MRKNDYFNNNYIHRMSEELCMGYTPKYSNNNFIEDSLDLLKAMTFFIKELFKWK